jgi:LysM repeat protein
MRQSAQRALHFGVIIILLAVFGAGCTLAGADPAPLTPVGAVPQEQAPTITPQIDPTIDPNVLPTPTEVEINVFATQTAMALIPTPTPLEPAETTPEETIVPPTDDATEAPPEETQAPETTEETTAEVTEEAAAEASTGTGTCKHTIASGENLYRIALKYEITYQQLAEANGIANPDAIRVGDELTIPGCQAGSAATTAAPTGNTGGDTLHTVQTGENLYRIAVKYGTTWTALASYNGIDNPNALVVGQTIRIPASQ